MRRPWLRLPTDLRVRDVSTRLAWVELLDAWDSGVTVTVTELAAVTGWSRDKSHTFMSRAREWAVNNGAELPDGERARVGRTPAERGANAERTESERPTTKERAESARDRTLTERSPNADRTPTEREGAPTRARLPYGDQRSEIRETPSAREPARASASPLDQKPGDSHEGTSVRADSRNWATAGDTPNPSRADGDRVVQREPVPATMPGAAGGSGPVPGGRPPAVPAVATPAGDPGLSEDTSPIHIGGRKIPGDLTALLYEMVPGGKGLPGRLVAVDKPSAVRTTRALLAVAPDDLRYVPGLGGKTGADAVVAFLRARWGIEPGCLAAAADPDLAAWDLIWTLPAPVPQGPPLPDGTLSPRHLRAVQALGGRLAIRSASTFDIPKLKARFIEACRSAS